MGPSLELMTMALMMTLLIFNDAIFGLLLIVDIGYKIYVFHRT